MSDSVWPHRRQPTRLLCPWDSPGKNTGVGCHFLLQFRKVKSESEVVQSCPTVHDPMYCNLPGSSAHGIFQARVLEWSSPVLAFSIWASTNTQACSACIAYLSLPHYRIYRNFTCKNKLCSGTKHSDALATCLCYLKSLYRSLPLCLLSNCAHIFSIFVEIYKNWTW